MNIIAFEAANSYVKIKSRKGDESYPNVKRLIDVEEDLMDNPGSDVYRIGEESYLVGERRFSFITSSSRDADRYASPDYKVESLIAIAKHAKSGDNIHVVTGLPAIHYKSEKVKNDIINSLSGRHDVYINEERKTFNVEKVSLLLQPYAALISVIVDEYGNVRNEEIMTAKNMVIDVGWGTTDVSITDGTKIIDHIPVEYSMMDAYESLVKGLQKEYEDLQTMNLTPLSVESQLRNEDTFKIGGEHYPAQKIKEKVFAQTANNIMRMVKGRKYSLKEFDYVFFAGGGVEALAPYLKEHMEGKNAIKIKQPQMAIVRGLYNFGVMKG